MIRAMMDGWERKYGNMADMESIPMN